MKNTTLRQLTVFLTAARHLHFTRAAQELGMTQPSVSMQIRQLEENLGIALFEQVGKRTFLTEAGHELYRYGCAIDRQLAEADTVLDRLKGAHGGQLRLAIGTTAKYFMPRLLAAFTLNHPEVVIDLHITGRDGLLDQLENNQRDMAVAGSPPQDDDMVAYPFLEDPLVVIAPPGHPLAGERKLSLARLKPERFLMREPGSDTREVVDDFFRGQGFEPRTTMIINSNEAIKQSVQAGIGLAIVPTQSVTLELEVGRLVVLDLDTPTLQHAWYLVHRREKRFSAVAEAFKDFVLDKARHCLETCAQRRLPRDIECLTRQQERACPIPPDAETPSGPARGGSRRA
ncbi:MAG: LysR family transcriptional regulator [Gammaproteobacteria bacterium]|nr:LysR family transcriptional regulator [Gammaproteobacteria bacterium]